MVSYGLRRHDQHVSTYHLALVRPPYDCLVVYHVLGRAGARHDLAIANVERVQDTHDGVLAGARSLLFLQELPVDVLSDEGPKVRWMQLDRLLKLFEKKHVARYATGLRGGERDARGFLERSKLRCTVGGDMAAED